MFKKVMANPQGYLIYLCMIPYAMYILINDTISIGNVRIQDCAKSRALQAIQIELSFWCRIYL